MLFVVHALDRPDALTTPAKNYRAHRAHLDQAKTEGMEVVSAGPLVADDGETPIGSLLVFDANDRDAVESFCKADPYQLMVSGIACRSMPMSNAAVGHPRHQAAFEPPPAGAVK